MVEGGMSCVKYLIFIFNVVFLFSGIGIIVVGSLVTVEMTKYNDVLHTSFSAGAILLIVVGCIITVIAFLGCCGAVRESRCMMITFAILLGLIIILEMAAAILCFLYKDDVNRFAHDEFKKNWDLYNDTTLPRYEKLTKLIDVMQHDLHCCGVDGASDWTISIPWGRKNGVPESCCMTHGPDCSKNIKNIFIKGCYDSLKNVLENELVIIAGVGIGIASMQLAGIILACCLACAIRDDYRVV